MIIFLGFRGAYPNNVVSIRANEIADRVISNACREVIFGEVGGEIERTADNAAEADAL